jgi:hypothetical protein
MTEKLVDSIDYMADAVQVAPRYEWRIMEINVAKVTKVVPRYCQPTCPDYKKDNDKMCRNIYECESWVFDFHVVEAGEKVFDVMFGTSNLDPHTGIMWRVGEKYLRENMGEKYVDKMVADYIKLITPPEKGFKLR